MDRQKLKRRYLTLGFLLFFLTLSLYALRRQIGVLPKAALKPDILPDKIFSSIFTDTFSSPVLNWRVDKNCDSPEDFTLEIAKGVLKAEENKPWAFSSFYYPNTVGKLPNSFEMEVQAKSIGNTTPNMGYGLFFYRNPDFHSKNGCKIINHIFVRVINKPQDGKKPITAWKFDTKTWEWKLLCSHDSLPNNYLPNDWNTLKVVHKNDNVVLYLNQQEMCRYPTAMEGNLFGEGGIFVDAPKELSPSSNNLFFFDNFSITTL